MKQAQVTSNEIPSTSVFGVKANPNPYSDIFNLTVTTSSEEKVGIRVYDMIGRLIEQRDVRPSDIDGLQMGIGYPTGVYNIVLSQGTDVKALRVVKR